MVEPLLYAALGFLTASLVALFMGRALWNRAVRLTTHRIMRRLPLSRDEIVASRDLLRAEQAIEHRRLERLSNVMRQRMTQSMADIGRRDATNFALRTSVGEASAKLMTAEAREAATQKTIEQLKAEAAALKNRLAQTESGLNETQRGHKKLDRERTELVQLADTRRAEVAAATAETAQMRLKVSALEKQLDATARELADLHGKIGQSTQAARSEAERADGVHQKLATAEAELVQALARAGDEARAAEILRTEKAALERDLEAARMEAEAAVSRAADLSSDEIGVLRQQIERLAGDIARVAGSANGRGAGSGGVLQSAVRASRESEQVTSAPVTFPPVR
jgi:chromosome segregation ATPase